MENLIVTLVFGTLFIATGLLLLSGVLYALQGRPVTFSLWLILVFVLSGYMLAVQYDLIKGPFNKNDTNIVKTIIKVDTIFVDSSRINKPNLDTNRILPSIPLNNLEN